MYVVVDLEWDENADNKKLLVLGYNGVAYAWNKIPPEVFDGLADPDIDKIVFTKADHRWMEEHDLPWDGEIIDVQTMAWCYDERTPLDLDWCIKNYLGVNPDKRLWRKNGLVMFRQDDGESVLIGDAPIDQLCAYNERDLLYTEQLYFELERRLEATGQLEYWETRHKPFTKVLLDMEMNGLPIDLKATKEMADEVRHNMEDQTVRLKMSAGLPDEFNLGSRDQLANFLYTKKFDFYTRIKVSKETMETLKEGEWPPEIPKNFDIERLGRDYIHGKYELDGLGLKAKVKAPKCAAKKCAHESPEDCLPSVSSKVLKVHYGDNVWVEGLIAYRLLDKANQFLTVWLDVNVGGRIYARFNQTGTATGRLSSSDPNLQNIPSRGDLGSRIRGLFTAPEGRVLVNGDFSQIEPRLMAHFSGDPEMMRVFENGLDLYEEATIGVLGRRYPKGTPERQLIRTCFLAMGYGAQPPKIRNNLAEEGFRFPLWKVESAYNDLVNLYKVFWEWKDRTVEQAKEIRYVETIAGHRRHLDFLGENGWKAERQAVNSKVQGSAADIVQETMILSARTFPHWKMIAAVHDEIMFEVGIDEVTSKDISTLRRIAETGHGFLLNVPLVFEPKVVRKWSEAK